MSEERILTQHPKGKDGVNILRSKYETIKEFILETLKKYEEITFDELTDMADEKLSSAFDGKVIWYVVTVKLDLEARGLIERIPKTSPHKLRLTATHSK